MAGRSPPPRPPSVACWRDRRKASIVGAQPPLPRQFLLHLEQILETVRRCWQAGCVQPWGLEGLQKGPATARRCILKSPLLDGGSLSAPVSLSFLI